MVYAAAGLHSGVPAVHLLSFGGIQVGGQPLFFALHVGIFPLWIPVVWISTKLMGGMPRQNSWSFGYSGNYWKPMLSGCPAWMRYMTYGFFIYALVNFAIFIVLALSGKTFGGVLRQPLSGMASPVIGWLFIPLAWLSSRRHIDVALPICHPNVRTGIQSFTETSFVPCVACRSMNRKARLPVMRRVSVTAASPPRSSR